MTAIKNFPFYGRVGFFGIGKSNLALLDSLPLDGAEIVLRSDKRIDKEKLPKKLHTAKIFDGARAFDEMCEDVLFLSPSVRRDRRELLEAVARGIILSSDAELFFESIEKPLFAVTGSDGKSTTATLVSLLLCKRHKTELVGNIGQPMLSSLKSDAEYFVAELSSFMLTYSAPKSTRGAVTNITPNHLDWHKSFEEYKNVKLSLLRNAEEAVISFDDDILREYAASTEVFGVCAMNTPYSELKGLVGAKVYVTFEKNCVFINGEPIINRDEICRREAHNVKNLLTAIAMTYGMVSISDIRSVAENFRGLHHRCELIKSSLGVDFYNSSIDSTPSRSVQTLRSLGRRCVVILGGRGKGTSYKELCPALREYAECAVITGENADDIYTDIKGVCRTVMVDNFDDAVEFAAELGRSVGCVLLSPASTSYDAFENFEARGERFNFLIKNR